MSEKAMKDEVRKYTGEDGTVYEQRPVVFRQLRQLVIIFRELRLDEDIFAAGAAGLKDLIMDGVERLHELCAVLLFKDGQTAAREDGDIAELAAELDVNLPPETMIEVIDDFFTSSRMFSLSKKLAEMKAVKALTEALGRAAAGPQTSTPMSHGSQGATRCDTTG